MPSSSNRLRAKFMVDDSDGIFEAEKVIIDAGGRCHKGVISFPDTATLAKACRETDVGDACTFLLEEWDYGYNFNAVRYEATKTLVDLGGKVDQDARVVDLDDAMIKPNMTTEETELAGRRASDAIRVFQFFRYDVKFGRGTSFAQGDADNGD